MTASYLRKRKKFSSSNKTALSARTRRTRSTHAHFLSARSDYTNKCNFFLFFFLFWCHAIWNQGL